MPCSPHPTLYVLCYHAKRERRRAREGAKLQPFHLHPQPAWPLVGAVLEGWPSAKWAPKGALSIKRIFRAREEDFAERRTSIAKRLCERCRSSSTRSRHPRPWKGVRKPRKRGRSPGLVVERDGHRQCHCFGRRVGSGGPGRLKRGVTSFCHRPFQLELLPRGSLDL